MSVQNSDILAGRALALKPEGSPGSTRRTYVLEGISSCICALTQECICIISICNFKEKNMIFFNF